MQQDHGCSEDECRCGNASDAHLCPFYRKNEDVMQQSQQFRANLNELGGSEMAAERWVIEYDYPGTVQDKPVGFVFALNINQISPGAWSYTKDPNEATAFTTEEDARAEATKHAWPRATVRRVVA